MRKHCCSFTLGLPAAKKINLAITSSRSSEEIIKNTQQAAKEYLNVDIPFSLNQVHCSPIAFSFEDMVQKYG